VHGLQTRLEMCPRGSQELCRASPKNDKGSNAKLNNEMAASECLVQPGRSAEIHPIGPLRGRRFACLLLPPRQIVAIQASVI